MLPYREGLYLIEAPLGGTLIVRGALILGSVRAVVWDTLTRPDDMQAVLPLLGDRPVTVIYSHADWDHIWGTAALPYAEVLAHTRCAARFADPTDVAATLREHQAARPGYYDAVTLVPPTRTFEETLSLDLGDLTLELYALPGHTPDCIVAFVPAWKILFAGDTVETPLPYVPGPDQLAGWAAALERWAADERIATVIPCHGMIGGSELLRRNAAYLRGLPDGSSPLPPDLDEAYKEVHTANLRAVQGG